MRIEPDSSVPVFQQIVDGIRAAVAAGVYRTNDRIPSVRAQALALLVNPNTVQRAYEQLEREGLIVSQKGVGMVVSADSQLMARNGVHQSLRTAMSQLIAGARSAGLSRAAIDRLYREAWSNSEESQQDNPKRGNT